MTISREAIHIYTIGHSNRTIQTFTTMLTSRKVQVLVDVRAYPQSQRHPQFSQDTLRQHIEDAGITYHWAGKQLGGMRKSTQNSRHIAISDSAMRAYADYMDTDEFKKAARQLVNLAMRNSTAIMCAERLPQQCHRSYIADHLLLQGIEVIHLIDLDIVEEHMLNPLVRRETQELIYDRLTTQPLI